MNIDRTLSRLTPHVLSILRIIAALLLLQHGLAKIVGFPPGGRMPSVGTLSWFAGWIELVLGTLLLLGAWTRCMAFVLSGEMAFAYFISHAPRGFYPILNGGELAVLYCFVFFFIFFAGGGPWSVDALRGKS